MSFTIAYNVRLIDQFTADSKKIERAAKRLTKAMGKNAEAAEKIDYIYNRLVKSTRAVSNQTGVMMVRNEKAAKSFDKVAKNASKAQKQTKKMQANWGKIGSGLSQIGNEVNTKVVLPMAAAGVASVKMAMDMNKSMANVGSLIPGQTARLEKFKKQVMDLGVETGTSATVISEGLYETISAFGDAEDPINKLTIATRMSRAGLATVKESLSLVSAVTKGYGDTSDAAAQKVSDMAFMTVKLGQTTFPELANSMGRVVPIAAALNVGQKELFAQFATLTGVTGNAAEVSTQLASVMSAMAKPTDDLTKIVKKYGFDSATSMVKTIGLSKSLTLLNHATGGNADKISKLLGRKEALVAMLALTGGQADVLKQKMAAMGNVAGATDQAFKAQTEGINKVGFQYEQSKQRIFKMAVAIGDKLLPVVEKLLRRLEPWLEKLTKIDDETIDAALAFGEFALKVGLVTSALGKIITIGNSMSGIFTGLTGDVSGFGEAAMKATSKAGGLKSQLLSLKGAIGILGAAALGYSLGELADKAYFAPKRKEFTEKTTGIGNVAAKASLEAHRLSLGELQKRHEQLVTGREKWGKAMRSGALPMGSMEEVKRTDKSIRLAREKIEKYMQMRTEQMRVGPTGMFAGEKQKQTIMPTEQLAEIIRKDSLDITINTPRDTTAKVERKKKGGYTNVNVGNNIR